MAMLFGETSFETELCNP